VVEYGECGSHRVMLVWRAEEDDARRMRDWRKG